MDTHRLKYFLCVTEEGSITRAASVLGIAQPALSRQIQALEEDLGITLFRRTPRGVQLTDEGETLRASTAAPLHQLELALRYASAPITRLERGVLVGIHSTVGRALLGPLMASLSATFPEVSFSVTVASTDQLVDGMLKGAVDLAVINPVPDDRVFYRKLLIEDLVVIGGPRSHLDSGPLTFSDLVQLPLVLPNSPTGIGHTLQNTASARKVKLRWKFSTDSLELAKSLIEAGIAYGVLPRSACGIDIDEGRLRFARLSDPPLTQELGAAATSQLELPRQVATRVGQALRAEVARLINSGAWPAEFISQDKWDPKLA